MSKDKKDFLLFYDWYILLRDMSPTNAMLLLKAMVDYQNEGTAPPEFPEKIKGIAALIFGQLERRRFNMEKGRRGGEARAANLKKAAKFSVDESDDSETITRARMKALIEAEHCRELLEARLNK